MILHYLHNVDAKRVVLQKLLLVGLLVVFQLLHVVGRVLDKNVVARDITW